MAKNNNLKDFLTDVANAIREKKGTSEPINPQDFSSEIASIEGSGGGTSPSASKNDVTFYDYEGTILYSYTKEEFLSLNEMPSLPTREGLICQGWNYSMEDAVAYVSEYGVLDVGATYITDDGKTRLHIRIATDGRMNVPLYFSQTVANGVTIDWGDGSETQTLNGTGNVNTNHVYTNVGNYIISLNPNNGCTLGLGHKTSSYCILGSNGTTGRVYCNMLRFVEIGRGVTSIDYSAFNACYSLSNVIIPSSVTSIKGNAFYSCYSLLSVVIPNSVTIIDAYVFNSCYSLSNVIIPSGVTIIDAYAFRDCRSLSSVVIPSSVTSIGTYVFYYCYSISNVIIPNSLTSIGNSAFYSCNSISSVVISSGLTSIGNSAFYSCYGVAYYDFRASRSVPTLSNSNAFSGIPSDCKIVVPDSLYDSWIAATNWSTHASKIVKASEFNG